MTDTRKSAGPPAEHSPFESGARRSSSRVIWGALTVLVVVGAAAIAAWKFTRPDPLATASPGYVAPRDEGGTPVMLSAGDAQRIGVTYAAVERGTLPSVVSVVGLVAYDETRVKSIAPKVDGWVEQLFVAYEGQAVEAHDPLLRIYSPMLVTAEEELLLAHRLAATVGAGDADAARNAATMVTSARRRLASWDIPDAEIARVESTGEVERTITLRSPVQGVVVQQNVRAGQRTMPGESVYQVADLHDVWLQGEVFERDLAVVRVGQAVTAEFASLPGVVRSGRIAWVSPALSPETRTATIRVALANPGLVLKPGMYATIHVQGTPHPGVLNVPRSAVLVTGTRALVFVKGADGMLTPHTVEVGRTTDERVEILSGVREGDTVVSSATFLVDAESNLGSALGAMVNMPGMDHGAPQKGEAPMAPMPGMDATPKPAVPAMAPMPGMDHGAAKQPATPMPPMPGMDHPAVKKP